MKKIHFFGLLVALIFIAGCITYTKTKSTSPEETIKSMLPQSWVVSLEEESVPSVWNSDTKCMTIRAENPSEIYSAPFGNYSAWHNFWFCPSDWNGTLREIGMTEQTYPAITLCNSAKYKIFYLSIGENSEGNLPEKIKKEYCK